MYRQRWEGVQKKYQSTDMREMWLITGGAERDCGDVGRILTQM